MAETFLCEAIYSVFDLVRVVLLWGDDLGLN